MTKTKLLVPQIECVTSWLQELANHRPNAPSIRLLGYYFLHYIHFAMDRLGVEAVESADGVQLRWVAQNDKQHSAAKALELAIADPEGAAAKAFLISRRTERRAVLREITYELKQGLTFLRSHGLTQFDATTLKSPPLEPSEPPLDIYLAWRDELEKRVHTQETWLNNQSFATMESTKGKPGMSRESAKRTRLVFLSFLNFVLDQLNVALVWGETTAEFQWRGSPGSRQCPQEAVRKAICDASAIYPNTFIAQQTVGKTPARTRDFIWRMRLAYEFFHARRFTRVTRNMLGSRDGFWSNMPRVTVDSPFPKPSRKGGPVSAKIKRPRRKNIDYPRLNRLMEKRNRLIDCLMNPRGLALSFTEVALLRRTFYKAPYLTVVNERNESTQCALSGITYLRMESYVGELINTCNDASLQNSKGPLIVAGDGGNLTADDCEKSIEVEKVFFMARNRLITYLVRTYSIPFDDVVAMPRSSLNNTGTTITIPDRGIQNVRFESTGQRLARDWLQVVRATEPFCFLWTAMESQSRLFFSSDCGPLTSDAE